MKTLVWVLTGAAATWFFTAVGSRWGAASHLCPDAAIIVVTFLAMRREPAQLATVACILGYLVGRQMLAPLGLTETAMVLCSVATYLAVGHLSGGGRLFLGIAAGGAVIFYHLVIFLLLLSVRGEAGFPGWTATLLLPNGALTMVVAWIGYPALMRLERTLTPEKTDGLTWR